MNVCRYKNSKVIPNSMIYKKYTMTTNLLQLITELSKDAVYKINIQKETVFLHTSNEQL